MRVPRADESLLAIPPLSEAAEPARRNRDLLDAGHINVQGRSLARLREWTRGLALQLAAEGDSGGRSADLPAAPRTASKLLFVTGHQPSLFHPGVWAKNFAIHALAEAAGGTALNLIIDNDVVSTRRIRVPTGDRDALHIETLAFDQPLPAQPWEEAAIGDRGLFDSFGERVTDHMAAWGVVPVAADAWPAASAASAAGAGLRDALTAVRVTTERRWGVRNLELPLSRLCGSDAFLWFAAHLLAHLPRFRESHNAVLAEYRRVNRLRSRTHPVPELAAEGEWLEAPFWVWGAGEPLRKRVFARQLERHVELSDGVAVFCKLRLRPEMDGCCAVEDLRALQARGLRFRTRALTTTLFARLCLADLFVHGIGGAKYDEMTDRLIARFFGLQAPAFLTLSATLRLPLGEPFAVSGDDERRLRRQLRDIDYNAERFLSPEADPEVGRLVAEKERLLCEQDAAHAAAAGLPRRDYRRRARENFLRYLELRDVQAALARRASAARRELQDQLQQVERRLAANAVLSDREYSFCLYPEEKLKALLVRCGTAERTET